MWIELVKIVTKVAVVRPPSPLTLASSSHNLAKSNMHAEGQNRPTSVYLVGPVSEKG